MPAPRPYPALIRRHRRPPLGRSLLALVCAAGTCLAQPATPAIDPIELTGRTFAGVALPVAPSAGTIRLTAARAWTWEETERVAGAVRTTRRILLDGDAELRLGVMDFRAAKAALWLEPRGVGPGGGTLWQVFAVLDRATTPTADAAISFSGDRLPVQGLLEVPAGGGIDLRVSRRVDQRPPDPFVAEAERTLARRLRDVVAPPPPPGVPGAAPEPLTPPGPSEAVDRALLAEVERALGPSTPGEPIFARSGVFTFAAGHIEASRGESENSIVLTGGVNITYWEAARDRTLQLSARRAVVLLDPGPLQETARAGAEAVRGVYLEGDVVATDGRNNLRAPQVYYDVRANRAMLLDAVYWTYDQRRSMPLYLRAKTLRQESQTEFRATAARVSNTAFFEPDLSIGAREVTVSREPAPPAAEDQRERLLVDARDITLRAGGVPFFYWPVLRGDPEQVPLQDARIENSGGSGAAIKTTWNAVTLLGGRAQSEFQARLRADYYFDRGAGLGTDARWSGLNYSGGLLVYGLPNDTGRDVLSSGDRQERDGEFRGLVLGEHQAQLTPQWRLFAEGAYVSDPQFPDVFFRDLARSRREFASSLYARRLEDNTYLSAEARGTFNDFISNQWLLQTPGYSVERLPDVRYARLADDLIPDSPGLLTWSSEYRASYMRLRFDRSTGRERGYPSAPNSIYALGVQPGETLADALRRQGLSESPVGRFDTRQELTMPLIAGPVSVTPFVAGRLTNWSEDFRSFSINGEPQTRVWGAGGLTLATEIQRVYNGARSRLLDVNRLRHIIQPQLTVWHAATNRDQDTLPVYDPEVESLQGGTATRIAVNQIFQTQRGGPGRWRSVDLVTWDTELVLPSGDTAKTSAVPRWYDARPEYSVLGDAFIRSDLAWQVTEILGVGGGVVFDYGPGQLARSNFGLTLRGTQGFSAYGEFRSVPTQDESFLNGGVGYQLTRKYALSLDATYNTQTAQLQSINASVRRQYPNILLGFSIGYETITDRTSFGFVLQPMGARRAESSPAVNF